MGDDAEPGYKAVSPSKVEDAEPGTKTVSPSKVQQKGGFKATSFIYALVALENMGLIANMVSLVLYFLHKLYFHLPEAANTLTNLMGSLFLLSIVGGFISDTYIDRFHTSLIFGTIEVLALAMMTYQAHTKSLLPAVPCISGSCMDGGKGVYFYASLSLMALGVGGVRGALPALGADQFDKKDPKGAKALASYFNWLLLSTVSGAAIGVTFIVYLATNKNNQNWWKGFLITTVSVFVGFVILALGKPFYRLEVPKGSPLTRIAEVIVVAIKNRRLSHPESPSELFEVHDKDAESETPNILHTDQFRFLDKAAILPENRDASRWKVCTVTQIEELKVLIRMLPIIGSTIIMNTCLAQLQTFSVQQGYQMDGKLGKSNFVVPAASVPVIPLLFMVILIPIYDRFFVPFARKFTNHPSGITPLQRVGVGLALSAISMSIAGVVEVKRKNKSEFGHLISIFWLAFQYGIFGIADMFTLVGLLEFFYKEAPAGMKSMSTSLTWISLSFGYFLSSALVDLVNFVSSRAASSGKGWLQTETGSLDETSLSLFYWFLAILSVVNFLHYLYWAIWYKYKNDGGPVVEDVAAPVVEPEAEDAPKAANPAVEPEAAAAEEEVDPSKAKE